MHSWKLYLSMHPTYTILDMTMVHVLNAGVNTMIYSWQATTLFNIYIVILLFQYSSSNQVHPLRRKHIIRNTNMMTKRRLNVLV